MEEDKLSKESFKRLQSFFEAGDIDNIKLAFQLLPIFKGIPKVIKMVDNCAKKSLKNKDFEVFFEILEHDYAQMLPFIIGLKKLDCSECGLESLPNSISELRNLKILNCRNNQLDSLPESIGKLQNLESLCCSENLLKTLPDSIGELKNLKWLNCSNNQLTTLPVLLENIKIYSDGNPMNQ